jgi:hypothetical protein
VASFRLCVSGGGLVLSAWWPLDGWFAIHRRTLAAFDKAMRKVLYNSECDRDEDEA